MSLLDVRNLTVDLPTAAGWIRPVNDVSFQLAPAESLGLPKLLIADEPTTALDVTVQKQILDLLDRLRRELKLGLVFITHDLGVVAQVADRIAVMYAGRIAEEGPAADVLRAPQAPAHAEFAGGFAVAGKKEADADSRHGAAAHCAASGLRL